MDLLHKEFSLFDELLSNDEAKPTVTVHKWSARGSTTMEAIRKEVNHR